jgi:hypothetical protein
MRHSALVLTYNRLDSALKICKQLTEDGVSSIFVSIDGGKTDELKRSQEKLISSLHLLSIESQTQISIRHSRENLGVSAGVISGVDWFFEKVDSGYIFEDDLFFSGDFLDFADMGLEFFRNDETVWMISGNQYLSSDSNWSNYPLIWGWATWKTKWVEFRSHLLGPRLSFSPQSTRFRVKQFWEIGFARAINGGLDSWAVPYASQMLSRQKLCLLPPVNLVSNIGVDDYASHTRESAWHTGWNLGDLRNFPNFSDNWYLDSKLRICSRQNRLLEREIYRIRFRHVFIKIYSRLFDSFRFERRSGLLSRLSESTNNLTDYYFYNPN